MNNAGMSTSPDLELREFQKRILIFRRRLLQSIDRHARPGRGLARRLQPGWDSVDQIADREPPAGATTLSAWTQLSNISPERDAFKLMRRALLLPRIVPANAGTPAMSAIALIVAARSLVFGTEAEVSFHF